MYLFIELTLNTYQGATGRIWGELVTCVKLGTLRDKKGDPYDKVTGVPHPGGVESERPSLDCQRAMWEPVLLWS